MGRIDTKTAYAVICVCGVRKYFEYSLKNRQIQYIPEVHCESLVGFGAVFGEFYFGDVKEDTAAMPLEGGEADNLEIGVYFGAVIDDFEGFAEKRGTLVAAKPL